MAEYFIEYTGDLRTKCMHSENQKVLLTDAPKDNQGLGEEFSPTDLVGVALGSCILTIMGIYAKNMKVDIKGACAVVTKEMEAAPVRKIKTLKVVINIPQSYEASIQEKLEKGGLGCPVHHSLDVEQEVVFNWGVNEA